MILKIGIRKVSTLIALTLVCVSAFASDIDKAFKYLNTGDYPNARKYLLEVIADEPASVIASYGMAKYYFAKDNPAYNLDSANIFVKFAADKLPMAPDDKATKKALTLGVRDYTITSLLKDINNDAYARAEKTNTLESYQFYIDNYTDKGLLNQATGNRNQLAFIRARAKNTPDALDEFIKKYPDADQKKEATDLYEKLLYEQTTADGTYQSYRNYTTKYPLGAYVKEANKRFEEEVLKYYNNIHTIQSYDEFIKLYSFHPKVNEAKDSIYALAVRPGTVEALENFVTNRPNNPNINLAWDDLYTLYTAEATPEVFRSFKEKFPNYPKPKRIDADIENATKDLKPIQQGQLWGYAYQPTKDSLIFSITGEYEEAFEFSNGLAAVRAKACNNRCVYFYINKTNQRAIEQDFNYAGNFNKGYAIVGIGNCEDEDSCKYGIIDKRGKFVVPPTYDIIEDMSEGLYLASNNERYGFINARGEVIVSLKYTNALPFNQGVAAVAIDSNWFFIDQTGKQLFINRFLDVSSFSDSVCAVTQDGENWGYIDMTGNFIIEPKFESAEDFVGGFAIVSKKEKDPKVKGLMISQRYKIDKTGKQLEKLTAPKTTTSKSNKRKKR